jgi:hypothetical protein
MRNAYRGCVPKWMMAQNAGGDSVSSRGTCLVAVNGYCYEKEEMESIDEADIRLYTM